MPQHNCVRIGKELLSDSVTSAGGFNLFQPMFAEKVKIYILFTLSQNDEL